MVNVSNVWSHARVKEYGTVCPEIHAPKSIFVRLKFYSIVSRVRMFFRYTSRYYPLPSDDVRSNETLSYVRLPGSALASFLKVGKTDDLGRNAGFTQSIDTMS